MIYKVKIIGNIKILCLVTHLFLIRFEKFLATNKIFLFKPFQVHCSVVVKCIIIPFDFYKNLHINFQWNVLKLLFRNWIQLSKLVFTLLISSLYKSSP